MRLFLSASLLVASLIMGCESNSVQTIQPVKSQVTHQESHLSEPSRQAATSFTGKVVFLDFEGGFWGIETDDQKKLDGTIPKELQIQGLRVKGSYQEVKDAMSYRMWGQVVDMIKLQKE